MRISLPFALNRFSPNAFKGHKVVSVDQEWLRRFLRPHQETAAFAFCFLIRLPPLIVRVCLTTRVRAVEPWGIWLVETTKPMKGENIRYSETFHLKNLKTGHYLGVKKVNAGDFPYEWTFYENPGPGTAISVSSVHCAHSFLALSVFLL